MMNRFHIRHLPVVDADGELVGVVSQRDLYLAESVGDIDKEEVVVARAMTQRPYTIEPSATLDTVAAHMAAYKAGSAVVVDEDGEVVGIFTIQDALVALVHLWRDR